MPLVPTDPDFRLPRTRLRTPLEVYRALKRTLERLVDKRLGAGSLGNRPGEYCAVGALYVGLAYPEGCQPNACPDVEGELSAPTAMDRLIDPMLSYTARESVRETLRGIVRKNDQLGNISPAERYLRVLAWVDAKLATYAHEGAPE